MPESPWLPPAPYPPPNPYGYQPSGGWPAPASKALAGWALGLSLVGCLFGIPSIVMAILVLRRSRDGRDHGKGMATAALIIVPVYWVLSVLILALVLVIRADRDADGAIVDDRSVRSTALRVGDCLPTLPEDGVISELDVVPCSTPHEGEVYAEFDLPDGDYPGDEQVIQSAERGCTNRFEGFVGRSYTESELGLFYLYPVRSSWSADQGVTCILISPEDVTGTLKDAGR